MERLIKPEVLDKYLNTTRVVNGIKYDVIFEYTDDNPKDSKGVDLAHRVKVGFRSESGKEFVGSLYLPMVMGNGLLIKNKSAWYRVNMLIPPLAFVHGSSEIRYVNRVINPSPAASSLNEFFPEIVSMRFHDVTPLVGEMFPAEAMNAEDMSNWNVITVDLALLELFNFKIVDDMERSQKGGYRGISGSIRALHTLLRAFVGYCRDEDDETSPLGSHLPEEIDEEEVEVGAVRVVDKLGSVLLHPLAKDINIRSGGPIDFCSGSPSKPIRTARIRDGYKIVGHKLVKEYESIFPYAKWRRSVVGIMSDDPRRVVVSRGISRALRINEPSFPYARTEVTAKVDSLSLPGIRMTHPLNHEDGIIVSETFARRMGAFKTCVDRVTVPKPVTAWVVKKPEKDFSTMKARELLKAMWPGERDVKDRPAGSHIIRRGDLLMSIQYKDLDDNVQTKEVRTKVKSLGIVSRLEEFIPAEDIPEVRKTYRFSSLVYFPLEVGDKIADAHGNKATVSAIWPDASMPMWSNGKGLQIRVHYIATPYLMKRLAVGAEIEDKLALIGFHRDLLEKPNRHNSVVVHSMTEMSMADVDTTVEEIKEEEGLVNLQYKGKVEMADRVYEEIPLSLRTMYRLDNNAKETLCGKIKAETDNYRRISKNARLGIDIVTMISRGATALVNQLIEKSGSKWYLNRTVIPIMYALQGVIPTGASSFEIKNRLERDAIGNPISHEELRNLDLKDTPCDPRIETSYGYIKVGSKRVIVPPHQAIHDLGKGSVTFSRISVYANRVFSEQHSRTRGYEATVEVQVDRYKNVLASMLTGKGGLVRDALLPVFPTTIRAVASSRLGHEKENPLTIAVPKREFNRLRREHPGLANVYSDRRNWYCLLKRDPVHRSNNVITVPFVLWDNDTIGISPIVIGSLDGDFDGDTLFAMFPTDLESFKDMAKMVPEIEEVVTISKMLTGVEPKDANHMIRERIGWTSTFNCPHDSDVLKNPILKEKLIMGMTVEERMDECLRAARDFEVIKDGTARTGALGLSFIFSRKPEKKHMIKSAMELYHVLAQNTLDAKAGVDQPALDVVNGVSSGNEGLIRSSIAKLGFMDAECIEEFVSFAKTQKQHGSRMRMLEREFPVLAITQNGALPKNAVEIASRVVDGTNMGGGIWEAMMDYLMGKVDNSPYEWADKSKVMTEKVRKLEEILSGKGS